MWLAAGRLLAVHGSDFLNPPTGSWLVECEELGATFVLEPHVRGVPVLVCTTVLPGKE